MDKFLSCDWGSSNFRLRLVTVQGFRILAEEKSGEGISETFRSWKQQGGNETDRLSFYGAIIRKKIQAMEQSIGGKLDQIPLIISGMASSSIGIREIPYKQLPLSLDGSDIVLEKVQATEFFPAETMIISGARTTEDVMRGEETQLIGIAAMHAIDEIDGLVIFPGTHTKHLSIVQGKLASITTFMTGECFYLLANQSILAGSVEESDWGESVPSKEAFEWGVQEAAAGNFLHSAFLARTNELFKKLDKKANYYYLSGLLIGTELSTLLKVASRPMAIVSDKVLGPLYALACRKLGLDSMIAGKSWWDGDEALLRGQHTIYLLHAAGN
jgi:2-dehydro-3-deoxygalactonokinase